MTPRGLVRHLSLSTLATVESWTGRQAAVLREPAGALESALDRAAPQGPGRHFTTPSWSQYRRIVAQHDRLRDAATDDQGG